LAISGIILQRKKMFENETHFGQFSSQHLALLVINAGRNNKRLRSEVAAKLKLAASVSAPPASSNFGLNPLPSSFPSLASFGYPQQQQQQQQLALSSLQQFQNALLQQQQQQQQLQPQPLANFANV